MSSENESVKKGGISRQFYTETLNITCIGPGCMLSVSCYGDLSRQKEKHVHDTENSQHRYCFVVQPSGVWLRAHCEDRMHQIQQNELF